MRSSCSELHYGKKSIKRGKILFAVRLLMSFSKYARTLYWIIQSYKTMRITIVPFVFAVENKFGALKYLLFIITNDEMALSLFRRSKS